MVRVVAINCSHLIDVIVLHGINKLFDKSLVKLEAREVFGRVLLWNGLFIAVLINEIASVLDETAYTCTML